MFFNYYWYCVVILFLFLNILFITHFIDGKLNKNAILCKVHVVCKMISLLFSMYRIFQILLLSYSIKHFPEMLLLSPEFSKSNTMLEYDFRSYFNIVCFISNILSSVQLTLHMLTSLCAIYFAENLNLSGYGPSTHTPAQN